MTLQSGKVGACVGTGGQCTRSMCLAWVDVDPFLSAQWACMPPAAPSAAGADGVCREEALKPSILNPYTLYMYVFV